MNKKIKEKLALLPDQPGCYLMKDRQDTVIYVDDGILPVFHQVAARLIREKGQLFFDFFVHQKSFLISAFFLHLSLP